MSDFVTKYAMKKRMAKGGSVGSLAKTTGKEKGVHKAPSWLARGEKGKSYAGTAVRASNSARSDSEKKFQKEEALEEHREVLKDMRSMKKPRLPMAEGGSAHSCPEDMVGRIMCARGGHVSKDDLAGFAPNEFDVLELEPAEEFSYTGANSGDEEGDAGEDERRKDIVSRIMKSRAKKDRNPNPA